MDGAVRLKIPLFLLLPLFLHPILILILLMLPAFAARSRAQTVQPSSPTAPIADLLRYEPTGLSLLAPYAKGKVPVVFVHGSNGAAQRDLATLYFDIDVRCIDESILG